MKLLKKLFKVLLALVVVCILVGGYFLYARQSKNIVSTVPYPYYFKDFKTTDYDNNAPILIIGDRMAKRLELFKDQLAKKISTNLSKPIKINVIAKDGLSLPRVLNQIKSYGRLPFIIIYAGASQEYLEKRFSIEDIDTIEKNFGLYDDLEVQTLLTIFPSLSKYIYHPLKYETYGEKIKEDEKKYTTEEFLKRNIFTYKLFERELKELFTYAKENNSYLIALTSPINLEVKPKKVCSGELDEFTQKSFDKMMSFLKEKDYKQAYSISKNLSLIASNNALIHYLHGMTSKALAKYQEAQRSLSIAASFDCINYRANPVYNSIIKKIAKETNTLVFDFNELVYSSWGENVLFESELYPQNLYYQKLTNILAIKIKRILKL